MSALDDAEQAAVRAVRRLTPLGQDAAAGAVVGALSDLIVAYIQDTKNEWINTTLQVLRTERARHPATTMNRDDRQRAVIEWVRETFGGPSTLPFERATRLLEEAVELAQAVGATREQVLAVVEHVYRKPPGDPVKEVAGVAVTLLAYCEARGISADEVERTEIARVLTADRAEMRRRQAAKADAGIGVVVTSASVQAIEDR